MNQKQRISSLTENQRLEYNRLKSKRDLLLKEGKSRKRLTSILELDERFKKIEAGTIAQHEMNHVLYPELNQICTCGYKRPE